METQIQYPATNHVHWPNQSVHMCDKHKEKADLLAAFMGFRLTSTPSDGEECANCVNEAKKGK